MQGLTPSRIREWLRGDATRSDSARVCQTYGPGLRGVEVIVVDSASTKSRIDGRVVRARRIGRIGLEPRGVIIRDVGCRCVEDVEHIK